MNDTIRNIVQSTGTVAGDAVTKLPTSDWANRESVMIHNASATLTLHLWIVNNGASAPSLDTDTKIGSIPPGKTGMLPFGLGIDLYGANSSGAATTSAYTLTETDMGGVIGLATDAASVGGSVTVTGVATEAKQDTQITHLAAIEVAVEDLADDVAYTVGAGAVDANTQRVVAATDSPDVTALQIIDDWDESDRAKVNPIVGQAGVAAGAGAVGATVQRMTLASDDPAVAALTTIDADTGALAAAVKVDDAAFTPATDSVVMLGAQADETSADSVNEGDAGALRMTLDRMLRTVSQFDAKYINYGGVQYAVEFIVINTASSGVATVVTNSGGKKILVLGAIFVANGAVDIWLRESTGTVLIGGSTGPLDLQQSTGFVLPPSPFGWAICSDGSNLQINLSAAVGVGGVIIYAQVD